MLAPKNLAPARRHRSEPADGATIRRIENRQEIAGIQPERGGGSGTRSAIPNSGASASRKARARRLPGAATAAPAGVTATAASAVRCGSVGVRMAAAGSFGIAGAALTDGALCAHSGQAGR